MSYNPEVWDPDLPGSNTTRGTGSFASQVEVDLNKGGLEELPQSMTLDQGQINGELPLSDILTDGNRGTFIAPVYQQGDTRTFYCYTNSDLNDSRITRNFTCAYAGEHCYVWISDNTMSQELAYTYGQEFDSYIYGSVTETFGMPRFAEYGSKIHLLYYPMPSYIGGCFCMLDLYSSSEVSPMDIVSYGVNADHPLLHINADFTAYDHMQTYMRSTMAHEFQHLIVGTNTFATMDFNHCAAWLNEAMSGYIEELLYPGVKEEGSGHITAFRQSDLVRGGLSMYNFATTQSDFGVYGSVYLYSVYLSTLAGEDIFSNVHDYWRNSYSTTLCEAEALANAVPQDIYDAIDMSITYPASVSFQSENDAWMSKLTLQFYLELLNKDSADPAAFGTIPSAELLYNEINPAELEGGGRIIIALQGDSYQIPADADTGLIYVGLDKDFQVVTDLIYS